MSKAISSRRSQRGATMVSVSLLSVALVSASLLLVRQANRSATESGVVVARERALMAAQAASELAIAYYREQKENDDAALDVALAGAYPATDATKCTLITEDCVPGNNLQPSVPTTGIRTHDLTGQSDCAGRACMRPGALAVLPNALGTAMIPWVELPLDAILLDGDREAVVTVWVRNNAGEALSASAAPATDWVTDLDGQVTITAMAEVHGTVVTVEQQAAMVSTDGQKVWQMASPDLGYGGGHNNDNVAVETCVEGGVAVVP